MLRLAQISTAALGTLNVAYVVLAFLIDDLRDYGFAQRFLLACGTLSVVALMWYGGRFGYRLGYRHGRSDQARDDGYDQAA